MQASFELLARWAWLDRLLWVAFGFLLAVVVRLVIVRWRKRETPGTNEERQRGEGQTDKTETTVPEDAAGLQQSGPAQPSELPKPAQSPLDGGSMVELLSQSKQHEECLQKFEVNIQSLNDRLGRLQEEVDEVREVMRPPSPPAAAATVPETPRRDSFSENRSSQPSMLPKPQAVPPEPAASPRISSFPLDAVAFAVRGLGIGNRELEPVIQALSHQLGGVEIEVSYPGGQGVSDWSLAILQPRGGRDAIVVAAPGLPANEDIARFFGVEHGTRIKRCLEPAVLEPGDGGWILKRQGKVRVRE